MSEITFKGPLEDGHPSRVSSDGLNGALHIGGEDVIDRIHELDGPVRVTFNGVVLAEGVNVVELGSGYSSWTPIDDDSWTVDKHPILDLIWEKAIEGDNELIVEELEP